MFWWNLQLLKFDNYRVRRRAVRWMGQSHDKRAIRPVTSALSDRHYLVRKAAAQALGEVGQEQALKPLLALAEESFHYAMARIAVHALHKVLVRTATRANDKDLEKAAILGDVSGFHRRHLVGMAFFTEASHFKHWTVDCSGVRNLACRELFRRGVTK